MYNPLNLKLKKKCCVVVFFADELFNYLFEVCQIIIMII